MAGASSSDGGGAEFVAFIGSGSRRRGPAFLHSRRIRFAIVAFLLVVGGGLYYLGQRLGRDRDVELTASADSGEASLEIKAEPNVMSPLCGCLTAASFSPPWSGIALPSRRFSLGVTALSSGDVRGETWQLSAMAPDIEPIDWVASPVQTVEMVVIAERDGRSLRLFHGRVTFLEVVRKGPMEVIQDPRFPYASLLPAYGGNTDISSRPPPPEGGGGSLDIGTWSPSRDWLEPGYGPSLEVLQRGPMLDLLGTTTFRLGRVGASRVYAGLMPVAGIRAGDAVRIKVRSPFALRLFPTPAPRSWMDDIDSVPPPRVYPPDASAQLRAGARQGTLVGRFLVSKPLPQYTVRLQGMSVPVQRQWSGLATRSARGAKLKPMLPPRPEIEPFAYLKYELPPVPQRPEISVFGKLAHYASDTLRGELKIDSESLHVHSGEDISIDSTNGVSARRHPYTSLISAGTPTGLAELSGSAQVSIDGDPQTTLTWLSWVAGAIGAALIALLLGSFVGWVRRGCGS